MRVALNAQLLSGGATYRTAGISRVIYELLGRLREVPANLAYLVFAPSEGENRALLERARLRHRLTRLPTERPVVRIVWEQLVLPLALREGRTDLLHAMAFVSPLAWSGPTVVTVYDLSFLRFPRLFNRGNRLYLRAMTPLSLRRATRVIAISQHARREAIDLCGLDPGRVVAIPLAAHERLRPAPAAAIARFRSAKHLPERFILYLGTLEPRKNVETLVRAFSKLRATGVSTHALVLAGAHGWQYDPIFDLVRELGVEEWVRFPGFVSEKEQALWYSAADIFAFPSLYEGFGLPPLESMACGTPVVASNSSSLPEVVGRAGLLVEPMDVDGLADALARLVVDRSLRAHLSDAGLARAAEFSWRRTAEQTVRVYEQALRA